MFRVVLSSFFLLNECANLLSCVSTEGPLHPEENVAAHTQAIAILLIVGRDLVCQSPRLIQDVVNLDTQVEIFPSAIP